MSYADYILTDNPITFFPINEGVGTVIEDVAGTATASITGSDYNWNNLGPLPGEEALTCNPTDEDTTYYSVSNSPTISHSGGAGTGWTVEFWARRTVTQTRQAIGLGGASNIDIYMDSGGTYYFWADYQDDTRSYLTHGYTVPNDTWAHVVIVATATGQQIWIDGVMRNSNSKVPKDTQITGIFAKNGVYRWPGSVAYFAGYDYALSQTQIEDHYKFGQGIIDTSTASTATSYSNQRKIDRCQNGVLWSMFWNGLSNTTQAMEFWYSTDDGATWTYSGDSASFGFSGTGTTHTPNGSFFIDLDDYAHVVYLDRNDGDIYYRRGTPNAGRTSWTWSGETLITLNPDVNYPDIVAHKEGTGYVAHVVVSKAVTNDRVYYNRVEITSGGTITVPLSNYVIGGPYSSRHKWSSIDFNHTGDSKTVAGGTPHLYIAWSAGATGSGNGIRFKKATYSGGSWSWGTEREIDSTHYLNGTNPAWMNCLFDGTRIIIAGQVFTGSSYSLRIYERNAADTTTTTRPLASVMSSSDWLAMGSSTYDGNGNVYLFGRTSEATDRLVYQKWERATTSLGTKVNIDATFEAGMPYVSAKRGYSNYLIDAVYTDGTSSPYDVKYLSKSVATIPSTPTLVSPVSGTLDRRSDVTFDWTHNGNGGGGQTRYAIVRRRMP